MIKGAVNITQATFTVLQNGNSKSIPIQFNPASLQYTIENTLSEPSKDGVQRQYVTQSSGKLTMDLVYDTTHSGEDVRSSTEAVAQLMQPGADPSGGQGNVPPVVQFEWGTYTFKGMVQQYKETIDFFSSNGVPLRAAINLTIASQTDVFNETDPNKPQSASVAPTSNFDSATSVATRGGDPTLSRTLASANGLDSLRFTSGASLSIGGGVSLQGPVAFATASAGAGLGIGIGAGAGIGISGGIGISASAGGSVSASAGISATAGAFAGLGASSSSSQSLAGLNVSRIRSQTPTVSASTAPGVPYGLGGISLQSSSPGLSANVGATGNLADVLSFGD